jgi:cyclopropane fatty-acyl-phospholipid synthase-like methyltransferase
VSEPTRNRETLDSYEQIARDYAESTRGTPTGAVAEALDRLLEQLPAGGTLLELGSGPGWDADFLEEHGLRVRRTDGTQSFCEIQRARGRTCDLLDVTVDGLTTPEWPAYDGVLALFVLQHVERGATRDVLARAGAALRPGGALLVSMREGEADDGSWQLGSSGRRYHVTRWTQHEFEGLLVEAGLTPTWQVRLADDEGDWLLVLATRN